MPGIVSYGAYVPPTRLALAALAGRAAKPDGPERAVAWNDEDSVTLGVAAARACLRGFEPASVDALLFASTTLPFQEKQTAALVAKALGLRRDITSADHTGSLRAGTGALRAAADAVAAGSARRVLVVASDCRQGAPGSALERNGGDGAAALLVGPDAESIATLEASHVVSEEMVDTWRSAGDPFVHGWEERFVVQEGVLPPLRDAVKGLCERSGAAPGDFAAAALAAPDARTHATAARALGLDPGRLVDPLFGRLGCTGAAFAPMLLASALEKARPGERLLVASPGDGAEALALRVAPALEALGERRGVSWHLARRRAVTGYDRYLKARELWPREWAAGGDPGLSATVHFRERDADLALCGQRCLRCQALQFPSQRVCESCFARDDFEPAPLAERRGRVVTYTFDFFFPTPDPPTIVTVTDVEGARVHLQLVDCKPADVRTGMAVEFVFRRIHQAGGRPNYYWKATPAAGSEQ